MLILKYKNIAPSGPMYYMNVMGRHFIVVNSLDVARDLLDKRSATYSHRPRLVMATELVGRNTLLFMNYGPNFRKIRKLVSTFTNARTAAKYWPVQEAESLKFVLNMKRVSGDAMEHCRWATTSLIIRVLYGIEAKGRDDKLVQLAEEFSLITHKAVQPGLWLVDSFPLLRYVPSFLPGTYFKTWARQARARIEEFATLPYEMVKSNIKDKGRTISCWTADQLLSMTEPLSAEDEKDIHTTATSLYSDTSGTAMATFILMMVRNPDVQRKAQEEIDRVTGDGHWIPGLRDCAQFPYIGCLVKEVFRINPIAPLVPHSLAEEDVYEGYRIPKGSWVMANFWAYMYDESRYPEPYTYRPERFEENEGKKPQEDPLDIVFGFGRRVCPGSHFGLATIFLAVVHMLFAFDILPAKDEHGRVIVPPAEFCGTTLAHPKPFPYRMEERSPERIALIELALANMHM
ncbi:uncharacterized protein PHACADRAFT_175458 [Phanerochaete carnosa HHB-10118-sp]|uniref:Cytochrome P450 n=1 Tax=Phanerochaete carnosa (strain HHB-10118-sp) TaxID=650164 RepID=K5USU1_PHACS|nr:uncharacterized protein PHACADRAFT_175458 [Phanerochaete carnosa HHB-10118-sp]EKM53001.1 hypothetical protein PHACADRAFT_175458 [Phanerochaete carnosa HHB-10118-sp]